MLKSISQTIDIITSTCEKIIKDWQNLNNVDIKNYINTEISKRFNKDILLNSEYELEFLEDTAYFTWRVFFREMSATQVLHFGYSIAKK